MKNLLQNENGFTLVEVLLTISLIGILSVSILRLFSSGTQNQTENIKISTAMLLAQGTLEQIKAEKKIKGFLYLDEKRYNKNTKDQNGIYQTVRINNLGVDLKKIVIRVEWSDGSDSLVSMIGKY